MKGSRFKPRPPGTVAAPSSGSGAVGALWPVVALCGVVLAASALAFNRGEQGAVGEAATCTTVTVPRAYADWDAFFAVYPFDDAFMKDRIEAANPAGPQTTVRIPLSDEDCR